MKTPDYEINKFLASSGEMIDLMLVVAFIIPLFRMISNIVQDKELKTREGMKMMGLKDSAYWLSFFVYYLLIFAVIAASLTAIVVYTINTNSGLAIYFVFYLLYGMATFSFGFLVASFFHKARMAAISGALANFTTILLKYIVVNPTVPYSIKVLASIFPTVAGCLGNASVVMLETSGEGVQFYNSGEFAENYSFKTSLIMLGVDFALYGILALYFDNVIPSSTGSRKSLLFFLSPSFWCGHSKTIINNEFRTIEQSEDEILYPDKHFDRVSEDLKVQEKNNECFKIRNLTKQFHEKQVVSDFSVNMYKGQIFALLGPNGAGKTTTISMLTGLVPPSSGSAFYKGVSVFDNIEESRETLGVCPQHDILFEQLTPREHLEIFASFKGRTDSEQIENDVQEIIEDIDLKDVIDIQTVNLSGGQKRKLSIGISFIGRADIIFLDEPTSGVDLTARKKLWAMLKKRKSDKVIILTTHYMEEAEELGDRIGIMAFGSLKCVGSPLFLNSVYGAGYNLIVLNNSQENQSENDKVTPFLKSIIPEIEIRRTAGKEVTYFLPKEKSDKFKSFFTALDANADNLNIKSYGMTTNTLEEIFLKVVKQAEEEQGKHVDSEIILENSNDQYSISKDKGECCICALITQFWAVIMKRYYIASRSWATLIVEILLPILLMMFGFSITFIKFFYDGDARFFTPDQYKLPQTVFINTNSAMTNLFTKNFDAGLAAFPMEFSGNTDFDILTSIDNELFEEHNSKNPKYGSLYLKTFDPSNHLYEFVVFANLMSQDSSGAFMSFFCQTLLRTALNNPQYKITFANSPLPLTFEARNYENVKNGNIISQVLLFALALVPTSIISFIVSERQDNLKHQQIISGISLFSYWTANAFFDMFKSFIPAAAAIGLIYWFPGDLSNMWPLILAFAATIIPFTYITSFLFNREYVAMTVTLLFHFGMAVVLAPLVDGQRMVPETKDVGIWMAKSLSIIPSFALAYGVKNMAKYFHNLYIKK